MTKENNHKKRQETRQDDVEIRLQRRTMELARVNVDLQDQLEQYKKAQAEIAELERQIEFILGATKTGLDIIDSDFNVVYIDPEWKKTYGDHKGKKCYEYFMGRQERCLGCGIVKAFETKKPVVTEEFLVKEGNRPIQVTTIPFQDAKGQWLVAEVNVDISQRKKTETELVKFRQAVNYSNDMFFIIDPETNRILDVNGSVSSSLGYSKQELLNMRVVDIEAMFPNSSTWEEHVQDVKKRNGMVLEGMHKRKDGSSFPVEVNARCFSIEGKDLMIAIARDISQRKQTEEALRRSEGKYRLLFDSAADLIAVVDTRGNFLELNKRFEEESGWSREEILGKNVLTSGIVTKASSAKIAGYLATLLSGKPFPIFEVEGVKKTGGTVPYELRAVPIKEGSKVVAIQAILRNLTERKKAQEEATRAEAFKTIIEGVPDAIIVTDHKGTVVRFNRTLTDNFGVTQEIIGQPVWSCIDDKGHLAVKKGLKECIEKGYVRNFEASVITKEKRATPVLINAKLVKDAKGNPANLIFVVTDITERKQLEELKNNFVNTVSHELRTPVVAIRESVSMILSGKRRGILKEDKECLTIAEKNAKRLIRLINDILDLQDIDSKVVRLNLRKQDINKLILECYKIMAPLLKQKGLECKMELEEGLPKAILDRDRIIQVLTNIAGNAIKFTEKGSIIVKTHLQANTICVSIKDTGIGVGREDMSKLFKRFEPIGAQRRYESSGTGLGLAICKDIVELHNGKIWAESEAGKGTTVYFTLPVK
ncbi:MAG: PAS domain S-box protein [Candidatus Omnitrophica bacterium]|nr:PAS domain S-box protein [Candidatus Omnitrophota bacterium]MBU1869909.1 PAS domain S-box protein [Candidatus Omnitrophota bacterium]